MGKLKKFVIAACIFIVGYIAIDFLRVLVRHAARDVYREHYSKAGRVEYKSDEDVYRKLRQIADFENSRLPMMLDAHTRADTVIPGPGKKITYSSTLLYLTSADLTEQDIQRGSGARIRNGVCTSRDTAEFVRHGVQFVYLYYGSDGGFIGEVTVNTDRDC